MIFWGSIAVCTIFWACLFYAVGGYNWFWPWNIMGIYYTVQLFKQNFWDKVKTFQTYAERWKFWWVFVMLTGLFATVNWTWATRVSKKKVRWDKQILIGTGVGFGLLFLSSCSLKIFCKSKLNELLLFRLGCKYWLICLSNALLLLLLSIWG